MRARRRSHGGASQLISCATCGALSQPYQASPPSKWRFYRALAHWKFAATLVEHIVSPLSARRSPAHVAACADAFHEIAERLASEESGEVRARPTTTATATACAAAASRRGDGRDGDALS